MLDPSMSVLEALADKSACAVFPNRYYLPPKRQKQIARRRAFILDAGFSPQEWNNTLHYVVRPPPI